MSYGSCCSDDDLSIFERFHWVTEACGTDAHTDVMSGIWLPKEEGYKENDVTTSNTNDDQSYRLSNNHILNICYKGSGCFEDYKLILTYSKVCKFSMNMDVKLYFSAASLRLKV